MSENKSEQELARWRKKIEMIGIYIKGLDQETETGRSLFECAWLPRYRVNRVNSELWPQLYETFPCNTRSVCLVWGYLIKIPNPWRSGDPPRRRAPGTGKLPLRREPRAERERDRKQASRRRQ